MVAIGFPLFLLAFMLAVHVLAIRHVMLAAVVFIAVLWRQGAARIPIHRPAAIWLAASALCGLLMAGFALTTPFDTAPAAARAVRGLRLENETWLSFPAQHGQGVSALTGIPFEGVELVEHAQEGFLGHLFDQGLKERIVGGKPAGERVGQALLDDPTQVV